MIRSRLRSPTSKSTTTTVSPICASAAPSAAVVVVFPTPPLPDVTTRTFAILITPSRSIQCRDHHHIVVEPCLHRPAAEPSVDFLSCAVVAVDRQQLGFDLLAKDAGAGIAHMACHG